MMAGLLSIGSACAKDTPTDLVPETATQAEHTSETSQAAVTQTETSLQRTLESMPAWSKDLASRIHLHGYAQAGYTYQSKGAQEDMNTFDFKRAIIFADARITDRWSLFFMYDFKGSVAHEYYTDYRVSNNKALNLRIGQFKSTLTYENPIPPTIIEAIDVLSEGVSYLAGAGADPLHGVQYGRDLGLSVFGQTNDGKLAYAFNVLNGQGVNTRDANREKDFIGHIDLKLSPSITLVATGQLGRGHAMAPSLYVPEITVGEDYKRNRWTAGFVYKSKSLSLHGEYLEGRDKDAVSRGAYVTGSCPIKKNLDVVGSYDFFNYNVDRHMDQHKGIVGLQYWFYKYCRLQLQYVYKNSYIQNGAFHHGACHAVMGQVQVMFN